MDSEVFSSIVSLHTKMDELTKKVGDMPCAVNANRLQNLEKVVYGAVKLILVAFVVAVIASVAYKGGNPAVADITPITPIIKKVKK